MPDRVPARWDPITADGVSRVEVWSGRTKEADIRGEGGRIGGGIIDGAVTEKWASGTRSTLQLTVEPSDLWLRLCRLPALQIRVWSGYSWGTSEHLIELGRFRALPPAVSAPRGPIQITAEDFWPARATFLEPTPSAQGEIKHVVAALMQAYIPRSAGLPAPVVTATSISRTPQVLWDGDISRIIFDALDSIGAEAFIDRDGTPRVQDRVPAIGAPLTGKSVSSVTTTEDWSKVYNQILVKSSNNDVQFDPVIAVISDPSHPAHPENGLGPVGFTYASPYFTSRDQAVLAAPKLLQRAAQPALSWRVTALADPSRRAGDQVPLITDLGEVTGVVDEINHNIDGSPMTLTLAAA